MRKKWSFQREDVEKSVRGKIRKNGCLPLKMEREREKFREILIYLGEICCFSRFLGVRLIAICCKHDLIIKNPRFG